MYSIVVTKQALKDFPKLTSIGLDKKAKDLTEVDNVALLAELMETVKAVTKKLGLKEYRVMINNGKSAGQEVFHLHIHILSNN